MVMKRLVWVKRGRVRSEDVISASVVLPLFPHTGTGVYETFIKRK